MDMDVGRAAVGHDWDTQLAKDVIAAGCFVDTDVYDIVGVEIYEVAIAEMRLVDIVSGGEPIQTSRCLISSGDMGVLQQGRRSLAECLENMGK